MPAHLCGNFNSEEVLQKADPEVLKATRKFLMIKDGNYESLVAMVLKKRSVELVHEKQLNINEQFAVPKNRNK